MVEIMLLLLTSVFGQTFGYTETASEKYSWGWQVLHHPISALIYSLLFILLFILLLVKLKTLHNQKQEVKFIIKSSYLSSKESSSLINS
jgi:flagellar biogenesis protein FliO